jgi:peptidyl-prolyl cis-trans isomerase SurA
MLTGIFTVLFVLALQSPAAIVLDRIAAVVGKRAIKSSDIDRDLRVTAFLNRVPVDSSGDSKHKAAERLIDQQIIRLEIATGDYPRASDSEAAGLLGQIRTTRFAGSDVRLKAELTRYGLIETQLQDQLLWQLTVLRFINERFRPGAQVSDDDVKKYYDGHLAELKREYVRDNSFETLEPKIRETLEGELTNKQFETWLNDSRKQIRIDYYQEALK